MNENGLEGVEAHSTAIDVKIGGLPFTFDCKTPKTSGSLDWYIRVPSWKEQARQMTEALERKEEGTYAVLDEFEKTKGAACVLKTSLNSESTLIELIDINAFTFQLQGNYHKAKGVGSFMLNNLLALVLPTPRCTVSSDPDPRTYSQLCDPVIGSKTFTESSTPQPRAGK